jgi:hypothetical protein
MAWTLWADRRTAQRGYAGVNNMKYSLVGICCGGLGSQTVCPMRYIQYKRVMATVNDVPRGKAKQSSIA